MSNQKVMAIAMKTSILSFLPMCLMLASCSDTTAPNLAPETIFADPDRHVITSVFNTKLGTTSTLYGNDAALDAASAAGNGHLPGEIFTLVTWELVPNPYWFGGNINGALQAIETVKVLPAQNGDTCIDYEIEQAGGKILTRDEDHKQQRINFIFGQKASVFP